MPRSIKTWICEQCGKTFEKVNVGHAYRFCSRSCATLHNEPSKHVMIPDGQPMSIRTQFRRKRAAGQTQAVFRFPFNENAFDEWSDSLAWLLGLIWSDGCLTKNSINICSKGRDLMETVCDFIGMDKETGIRPKNKGTAWYVTFTSKKVAGWMRGLGLVQAKSLVANFPDVPEEYTAAFVRGVLDGDGSVLTRKERKGQQVVDLVVAWCGAAPLMRDGLTQWLESQEMSICHTVKHYEKYAPVWRITITEQASLRRLYHLLYPSPDVLCLKRKYDPYTLWMNTPRARPGRPSPIKP